MRSAVCLALSKGVCAQFPSEGRNVSAAWGSPYLGGNDADLEQGERIGLGRTGGEPSPLCRGGPGAVCIIQCPTRVWGGQRTSVRGGRRLQRGWGARPCRHVRKCFRRRSLCAFGERGWELPAR